MKAEKRQIESDYVGKFYILVNGSNPNGDPDAGGDPRVLVDGRSFITQDSVKSKIRLAIEEEFLAVKELFAKIGIDENEAKENYRILCNRKNKVSQFKGWEDQKFIEKYFDVRMFGATWLKSKVLDFKKASPLNMSMPISLFPVELVEITTNSMQKDKEDEKNTFGHRTVVHHGVYECEFTLTRDISRAAGTTDVDFAIFMTLLPLVYDIIPSVIRTNVSIPVSYMFKKTNSLGPIDRRLVTACRPKIKAECNGYPNCDSDYTFVNPEEVSVPGYELVKEITLSNGYSVPTSWIRI